MWWKLEQYWEAIKLDNLNYLEENLDKEEKNKLNNFSKFKDRLKILKEQVKKLENWKKIEWTTLREKYYELNELKSYRKYLSWLKGIIENDINWEIFESKNISKYDLANYELIDFTEKNSWWIAMQYKDISSLNIWKEIIWKELSYNITGYIHYISIVDSIFVEKNLVVLNNQVYNISEEWELFLDEWFKIIDWIKIKELREWGTEKIATNEDFKEDYPNFESWEIIDHDIEDKLNKKINNLWWTSKEIKKIIKKYFKYDFSEYDTFDLNGQTSAVSFDEIENMFNNLSNDELVISDSTLLFISREFNKDEIKELYKEADFKIEELKKIWWNRSKLLVEKFELFKILTE